jgi:glycosyltransferase involved in cell wall biosynthesis
MTWAIITGEYPPTPGGVSDYTWLLAHSLVAAGDEVHVFAPGRDLTELKSPVTVHRLNDHFGLRAMTNLWKALHQLPKPRRIVVQFVPQSFGLRGANIAFAAFLNLLKGFPIYVMFHEFAIRDSESMTLLRRGQALATQVVAALAARSANVAFISTPAWAVSVRQFASKRCSIIWSPVPSNIETQADPVAKARLDATFRDSAGGEIIGHFGSYRMRESLDLLRPIILDLMRTSPRRRTLLLGLGSKDFAQRLVAEDPSLGDRLFASGRLDSQDLANHLSICDVLIQPYEDGVTTRRGSLIAALALGVPTVTTRGPLTEMFWESSEAILIAPYDAQMLTAKAQEALANRELRANLSVHARELYSHQFDIQHTVNKLRHIEN